METENEGASQLELLRLMTFLSPAFPVGAFSYSHGVERAVHDGLIVDRAGLIEWLEDVLARGSGWNDAVLSAEAWRRAGKMTALKALAELAEALAGSGERHLETMAQGEAFIDAVDAWSGNAWPGGDGALPMERSMAYPVAIGATAARRGIALEPMLAGLLHAFAANLVQAAVRLVPLGQRDGVAALAQLEACVVHTAERAANATLDDLGSCSFKSEILSMRHETQYSRLFRS
ncbi:urease accessory protein UreF [Pararhizobium haloflavum]|uniref:urease accessory protein UreF n=1 Tax=Pararhizobium haloflavum TaxID=2037914 RepID=UPI000C1816D3|nr:urease accessory protein UreF [Pararhizobium haloflavum]